MVFHSLQGLLCLLLLCAVGTFAIDIQGRIVWNDVCSNATTLGRAKVVLDSGSQHAGAVTASGNFKIFDAPVGTYLLSVISHDYTFDQLRIDVLDSPEGAVGVEVRPYIAGTPLNPPADVLLPHPITLAAKQKFSYFTAPESFNVLSMLSNPMTMMMVVAGFMMLATPYMMKNIDPEALEDFKKEQAKMSGVQNAIASGDFKGGISAIMTAAEEQAAARAAPRTGKGRKSKR
ncbi:hypothetical protein FA13DRAFT_1725170 [Coprinellus micaceus]|uniref:ER membrane protein complex subunit 7 beta-sandwich domain-containing protein n=1 Tax=Coprinellus micaceus TaxID=71717 RepID=A0A4Y7TZE6_COPMI|nr:hypothetical protein FA13DRAFT_1725170 [Coprinellus micaceus]